MTTTDYSAPPQWISDLFIDLYGDDMKDGGPSAVHIISAAFYFATSLDFVEKVNVHVEDIRHSVKDSFDGQLITDGEIAIILEQVQKNFPAANEFKYDEDAISSMKSHFSLLKAEIIKIGKMMRGN